ncbi:hypothetical protein [Halobacillus sp. Marseille-Q1614]|uniref:hypothetical protein n=1 Tax=Halobacillus sp. Marseille-Q1614 TaxID=2709134 RepID=UPI0015712497|nr:hypothetical protein [Halobacillus sp. Marseille-Q1614]
MLFVILFIVAIYAALAIWILGKLGSTPAQSVQRSMILPFKKQGDDRQKAYEQSISAR